jgi:hypothetical protein
MRWQQQQQISQKLVLAQFKAILERNMLSTFKMKLKLDVVERSIDDEPQAILSGSAVMLAFLGMSAWPVSSKPWRSQSAYDLDVFLTEARRMFTNVNLLFFSDRTQLHV